jgi:KUP system potassium uptake protein
MTAPDPTKQGFLKLTVGAIGVVFGDIGTSPLYALKQAFGPAYGLQAIDADVLGVLSLVFWSLTLVVSLKYVTIIMRADNRGEGGIVALMALAQRSLPLASETAYVVGAALFLGDGVITPAMSVLAAIEGLEVAAPQMAHYVVPATLAVLAVLFFFQKHGTGKVGAIFGPITVVWFLSLSVIGVFHIVQSPHVLAAVNPLYAIHFVHEHGYHAFLVLGAVVLVITGGEALYADMGHFGRGPIQAAWAWFVFPALILNYFGQGALLLGDPSAAQNPFYLMYPSWALYPMIGLATVATVIASQAVISGAFSLARQAVQLGYLPRLQIKHTSEETIGQVYVPWINRAMLLVVAGLVVGFRSSDNLASAYGVSVTGTMLITTLLLLVIEKRRWNLPMRWIVLGAVVFISVDVAFLSSNLVKFQEGGWFPVVLGVVVFTLMRTWRRGRELVLAEIRRDRLSLEGFIRNVRESPPHRVSDTAVFMTASNDAVPHALLHNLKYNKVLHERNVLLTVETLTTPTADADERCAITDLGEGFVRLTLRFGFMEEPNVPRTLAALTARGELTLDLKSLIYFASRETLVPSADKGMPLWRDKLFAFMARNTVSATSFFRVPGNRLVELGTQVEI